MFVPAPKYDKDMSPVLVINTPPVVMAVWLRPSGNVLVWINEVRPDLDSTNKIGWLTVSGV